jgi:DNA (cytosine-5)-methyltransferase 1
MANTSSAGSQGEQRQEQQGARIGFANKGQDVANTNVIRTQIPITGRESSQQVFGSASEAWGIGSRGWWDVEPNVGRVANGVAARVDRLKAIGNGQVPEVARTAWGLLK